MTGQNDYESEVQFIMGIITNQLSFPSVQHLYYKVGELREEYRKEHTPNLKPQGDVMPIYDDSLNSYTTMFRNINAYVSGVPIDYLYEFEKLVLQLRLKELTNMSNICKYERDCVNAVLNHK